LQYLLSFSPDQRIPSHIVEFDPSRPAWSKGANGNNEPEMVSNTFKNDYDPIGVPKLINNKGNTHWQMSMVF